MPVPKPGTVPDWATNATYAADGSPNKVAPSGGQSAEGWERRQKPPAQIFNWWKNLVGQWMDWLNDITNQALTWTAAHIFQAGITVTKGTAGTVISASSTAGNSSALFGQGHGTAPGVKGQGDAAANANGTEGQGSGTGYGGDFTGGATGGGVRGTAGGGNTIGTEGIGAGTGDGVKGTGGVTNGVGVRGQGTDRGSGVKGTGGAGSGGIGATGVEGVGGATVGSPGVTGTGGAGGGKGGKFTATGVDDGVLGTGSGAAPGVRAVGGNGNSPALIATRGDGSTTNPAIESDGSINLDNSTAPAGNASIKNQVTRQNIAKAWVLFKYNNGADPTIIESFNVAGMTRSAALQLDVQWAQDFATDVYGTIFRRAKTLNSINSHVDISNDVQNADHLQFTLYRTDGSGALTEVNANGHYFFMIAFGAQ